LTYQGRPSFFAMSRKDNADESAESDESIRSINRRRFVKGMGVVGGTTIIGSFASSAQATTSVEPMTADQMNQTSRAMSSNENIVNIMGSEWGDEFREGEFKIRGRGHENGNGEGHENGNGKGHEKFPKYIMETSGNSIPLSEAIHRFSNGNEITAIIYGTGDGELLAFYKYSEIVDSLKDKAELWDVREKENDSELSLQEASYNGATPNPVPEASNGQTSTGMNNRVFSRIGNVFTQSDDPCGGCDIDGPGDPNPGEELRTTCRHINSLKCVIYGAGCAGCGGACIGSFGTACAFYVFSTCFPALAECCSDSKDVCRTCAVTL